MRRCWKRAVGTCRESVGIPECVPKPILVRRQVGADRSGLAPMLYVAAERRISIRYDHISLPVMSAYAMDRMFEALGPWLGYSKS